MAIPFGTAAAMLLTFNGIVAPGSLFVPAWIFVLALLAPIVIDVHACGLDRLFRAENVLLMGLIIVLFAEVLQPGYSTELTSEDASQVFLASGVFATAMRIGSSFRPLKLPRTFVELVRRRYSARLLFRIVMVCWVLAMLNYAWASAFSPSAMLTGLLGGRWEAPWNRGQFGGWDAFRDFLTYFGHLVPVFTVLLALRTRSWTDYRVVIGLFCSTTFLAFVSQSGGRRIIVAILGSCLITWMMAKRRHLRPEHYLIVGAFLISTVVFLEVMLQQRNTGFGQFLSTGEEAKVTGLHVDNNLFSLGQTLRVIPSEADFVGFPYIYYLLVRPIPRVLWPGKPTSPGFDLAQHLGMRGVALSITSIGELYTSFGWIGIVLGGAFMGVAARFWNQLIEHDHGLTATAFYTVGAMAFFLSIRSLIEFILMSYPIFCWYTLDRFFRPRTQQRLVPRRNSVLSELT
jgi:hypothetical protein